VKTKDNNSIFIGKCWCEDAAYLDYYNPEVRGFWSSEIANSPFFLEKKNIHIWNDMNEPSVFKQTDLTIPKESKVNYYNETFEFRDVHNMYGYFMHKSSFEGLKKRLVNKRPFILTRSFYIGSHRYAAAWTGDNIATFNDLELSIPMLTNSALCGFSFIGADVGGFSKNTDHILMARWFQVLEA